MEVTDGDGGKVVTKDDGGKVHGKIEVSAKVSWGDADMTSEDGDKTKLVSGQKRMKAFSQVVQGREEDRKRAGSNLSSEDVAQGFSGSSLACSSCVSYEIVAKALALRISPYMNMICRSEQKGFIKGRHLLEAIVSLWEGLEWAKESQ